MNIFGDMPDIPPCPHCGHAGDGLQWAFPDKAYLPGIGWLAVQCGCLKCGAHGPARDTYSGAIEAFTAGLKEPKQEAAA
jgi:hypothetical protein